MFLLKLCFGFVKDYWWSSKYYILFCKLFVLERSMFEFLKIYFNLGLESIKVYK